MNKETNTDSLQVSVRELVKQILTEDLGISRRVTALEDNLTGLSVKESILEKNLSKACYKYDKMYLDNLFIPGLVGEHCEYPNLKRYIESHHTKVNTLSNKNEKIKIDCAAIKEQLGDVKLKLSTTVRTVEKTMIKDFRKLIENSEIGFDLKLTMLRRSLENVSIANQREFIDYKLKLEAIEADYAKFTKFKTSMELENNDKFARISDLFNSKERQIEGLNKKNKVLEKKLIEVEELLRRFTGKTRNTIVSQSHSETTKWQKLNKKLAESLRKSKVNFSSREKNSDLNSFRALAEDIKHKKKSKFKQKSARSFEESARKPVNVEQMLDYSSNLGKTVKKSLNARKLKEVKPPKQRSLSTLKPSNSETPVKQKRKKSAVKEIEYANIQLVRAKRKRKMKKVEKPVETPVKRRTSFSIDRENLTVQGESTFLPELPSLKPEISRRKERQISTKEKKSLFLNRELKICKESAYLAEKSKESSEDENFSFSQEELQETVLLQPEESLSELEPNKAEIISIETGELLTNSVYPLKPVANGGIEEEVEPNSIIRLSPIRKQGDSAFKEENPFSRIASSNLEVASRNMNINQEQSETRDKQALSKSATNINVVEEPVRKKRISTNKGVEVDSRVLNHFYKEIQKFAKFKRDFFALIRNFKRKNKEWQDEIFAKIDKQLKEFREIAKGKRGTSIPARRSRPKEPKNKVIELTVGDFVPLKEVVRTKMRIPTFAKKVIRPISEKKIRITKL